MNTKLLIALVIVLAVIGGGVYIIKKGSIISSPNPSMKNEEKSDSAEKNTSEENKESTAGSQEDETSDEQFTVEAANFSFSPKEIKVKKGDRVKINFKNNEGTHDWVLDEFNAKIDPIGSGKEASVLFTADKVGTFEYYCSVGKHRQMGMVGSLIVSQ